MTQGEDDRYHQLWHLKVHRVGTGRPGTQGHVILYADQTVPVANGAGRQLEMPWLARLKPGQQKFDCLLLRHLPFQLPVQPNDLHSELESTLSGPLLLTLPTVAFPSGSISPATSGVGLGFADFLISLFGSFTRLTHYRCPFCH
jgi:hypothetical protein